MMLRAAPWLLCAWLWLLPLSAAAGAEPRPVLIGLTAEFGMAGSHSAQSIERGILVAIDEINSAGGVLGGRKLALQKHDDRGIPARAVDHFTELAANPDIVAVFCGRFSQVALELAPLANRRGLLLLNPWAAADSLTRQAQPNYVFRLSLTDTWAIDALLDHARRRGIQRVALLVPNNAWGRSSEAALRAYQKRVPGLRHETFWYNAGEIEFREQLAAAQRQGARAIVMVTNETEASHIVQQMAALPSALQLPLISHWGVGGGDFAAATGAALGEVDLVTLQTFSFSGAQSTHSTHSTQSTQSARAATVAAALQRHFGVAAEDLRAQSGFAHAYDFTQLLALAIRKAGSSDRAAVRHALERIDQFDGLVRHYRQPFSSSDHEALDPHQLSLARFDKRGGLTALAGD